MEIKNSNNRNSSNKPRIYGTYDVERVKAQTVHSRENGTYANRARSVTRSAGNAPRNTVRAAVGKDGYRRRSPASYSQKNGSDKFLWLLIILAVIMVIGAFCFLVSFIKSDKSETGDNESGAETTVNTPEESIGETTAPETNETTAPETVPPELSAPIPEFKADLSAFEMYMNPTGEQRDAYLILVNSENPLSADYVPPNLVDVKSTRKDGQRKAQQLQEYAAKALEALMLEADACGMVRTNTPSGYPLSVMSAYRTYEYQRELFYDRYLVNEMNKGYSREEAEKIVATYSNRPGTSEHQAGLCVDMHTLTSAGQAFKNEPEAKWLAENCHKFGFILRYPEDKMEETGGIMYEPWHFRYVGRYHATRMKDLDMCLEEYVEYLKNNA